MKKALYVSICACLLTLLIALPQRAAAQEPNDSSSNDPLKAELTAITELPPAERITKLKTFIEANQLSALKPRAQELIVSARAALGEERLRAGDAAGGVEQFRLAIAESPASMSDRLFADVLARLPLNLYLRNERAAAFEIARLVEEKAKDNPARLLILAGFYLNIEEGDEAARLAEMVIKLAPDMAPAYQALGAARHITLRLDEAMEAYGRALQLDPKSQRSRRSLADLGRATGKTEEALALYRELLQADSSDKLARTGVVLSLFDLGKREEAERELEAALKDEPRNLSLLTGAAYWYAAQGQGARALELAERAVETEPRYTWAHIALARALLAQRRPVDAERALRFARQYGRFPTLDYELASVLATLGLYEEAATELARSFTLKGDQIETLLAGRTAKRAGNFIELLAPERRAGIFQPTVADTEENAQLLKGLLVFHNTLNSAGGRVVREADVAGAAREWTAGKDAMRLYRQLYAASRLLRQRVGWQTALELSEAARSSNLEDALDVPGATLAVMADELRDARARAINYGGSLNVPDVPRNVLASILRGRIEDITGVVLYNQDKTAESIVHLRRAISVLPENSAYWRTAHWHLGAAYSASGKQQEALAAYLKSYDRNAPDPIRRAVIEGLYRKLNGTLAGLDAVLGRPAPTPTTAQATTTPAAAESIIAPAAQATPQPTPEAAPVATTTQTPEPTATPERTPAATDAREKSITVTDSAPTQTATAGQEKPVTTVTDSAPPPAATETQPTASEQRPPVSEPQPTPSPEQTPARRPRTVKRQPPESSSNSQCVFTVSEEPLTIRSNGGSIIIPVTFNGEAGSLAASTPDWADIAVFAEPKTNIEAGVFNYSITSVSKRTGTFTAIFKSPCGTKRVSVTVN